MKRHTSLIASIAACSLLLQTVAFAQQDQSQQQNQQSQQAGQSQQQSEASKDELKVSQQESQQQVTDVNKASKLIGMRVKNKQNEDLGKIQDLVIDHQKGRVAYAVLSTGGFLGVNDKLIAIPLQALTLQQGQNHLITNLERHRLQQAPGFSQNDWPDLNEVQSGQTIGLSGSGQQQDEAAGAEKPGEQDQQQQQQDQQKQDQEQQQDQQQDQPKSENTSTNQSVLP